MMQEILGDYKILKQIGQEPLGSVFLAEHRFIKKQVVLTILSDELSLDQSFIGRFENEVTKLACLDHPNIIKLHTVSFSEDHYFFVTDCFEMNLSDYLLKKQNLKEDEIFSILKSCALALDYAHPKVVHGCLNPSHILMGPQKQIYVANMGLSKIIGEAKVITDALLNSHQDYSFLAPEQKRDNHATPSSDVYSFGVLAYFLLTGFFPEGIFEMPSKIDPSLLFDWDLLITKTLLRNPDRRVKELAPLLEACSKPALRPFEQEVKKEQPQPFLMKMETILPPVEEKVLVYANVEIKKEQEFTSNSFEKGLPHLPKNMVLIEGGGFLRGSNEGSRDEMPRHMIYIDSFAIDIHPVTNEEFVQFLEFNGGEKDESHDLIRLKDSRLSRAAGKLHIETGYNRHPVVGVSWYGAVAYAKWVGKRLPTEAEWEIAALGGLAGPYPTGETIEKSQANFFSSDTTAVMSYQPNGYGLYDMVGNIYEWCQDWYGYNYYETTAIDSKKPKGPIQGVYRVLRGGCWKSLRDDLRCSHRHRNNPGALNGTYGFRLVCDV